MGSRILESPWIAAASFVHVQMKHSLIVVLPGLQSVSVTSKPKHGHHRAAFGALQHKVATRVGHDGDLSCGRQLPKVPKEEDIEPARNERNDVVLRKFKQASGAFASRLLNVAYETETAALDLIHKQETKAAALHTHG